MRESMDRPQTVPRRTTASPSRVNDLARNLAAAVPRPTSLGRGRGAHQPRPARQLRYIIGPRVGAQDRLRASPAPRSDSCTLYPDSSKTR